MLGGNAIVVSLGLVNIGEAAVSRKTLELLGALNKAQHYPIGGRELSDTVKGLLMKYRSIVQQVIITFCFKIYI